MLCYPLLLQLPRWDPIGDAGIYDPKDDKLPGTTTADGFLYFVVGKLFQSQPIQPWPLYGIIMELCIDLVKPIISTGG